MEKAQIQEELTGMARQIQEVLKDFAQVQKVLDTAAHCLQANQEKCRAIGVEGVDACAMQLEEAILEATEYRYRFSAILDKRAAEYVDALQNCGFPMTPARFTGKKP